MTDVHPNPRGEPMSQFEWHTTEPERIETECLECDATVYAGRSDLNGQLTGHWHHEDDYEPPEGVPAHNPRVSADASHVLRLHLLAETRDDTRKTTTGRIVVRKTEDDK